MEKNIIYIPEEKDSEPIQSLGEMLFDSIKKHSDIVAQINPATKESQNYGTFLSHSIRFAQNLKAKGIGVGDIIAICSENNIDYASIIIGCIFNGTVAAPIDPNAHAAYFNNCLTISSPKMVFCDEKSVKTIEELLKKHNLSAKIVVFGNTDKYEPFSNYLLPQEPEETFTVYKPDSMHSLATILFTSGTTGTSKGVTLSYYLLLKTAMDIGKNHPMGSFTIFTTSPFWISNLNLLTLCCLFGDTRIIFQSLHADTIMKYVEEYKADFIFITPALGAKLITNPEYHRNYDISSLKVIATGGAATHPKQILEYLKTFPHARIRVGYGMTELGGVCLNGVYQVAEEVATQNKSVLGTAIPGFKYKIVNPETEEILGPNEEGELRIWHETVKSVYYNNKKENANVFDKNGYFKTGDLVYYDGKGLFFYVDRLKDAFKYYSYYVSPSDIEDVLIKHPNMSECVVFGLPETTLDVEICTAAVILKDKTKFNEEEIIEYANDRLPEQLRIRGGVYLFDTFPETATGKVQRRAVAELVFNMKNKK